MVEKRAKWNQDKERRNKLLGFDPEEDLEYLEIEDKVVILDRKAKEQV